MAQQCPALKGGLEGKERVNALFSPRLSCDCGCCCCYHHFLLWLNSQCIVGLRFPHWWDSNSICLPTHARGFSVSTARHRLPQSQQTNTSVKFCKTPFTRAHMHTLTRTHTCTLCPNAISTVINNFSYKMKRFISNQIVWAKPSQLSFCVCMCVFLLWKLPLSIQRWSLSAVHQAILSLW